MTMEKRERILYLECACGISGDMTVAALLDLGADQEGLERALKSLPVSGFQTAVSRVKKAGLDVCDFNVVLDAAHENHDHDMEYLHGHGAEEHPAHEHDHEHEHGHEHTHPHEHRGLPEILQILAGAELTERARELAERIFGILAEAESKAHGVPAEQVHFHEVGAVDSIVDIVAAAYCLDNLQITQVIVPELCEGTGSVRCQHGVLPVPVPAVLNIAQAYSLPLHMTGVQGELVTPTGAAIAAAVRTSGKLPERFCVKKTGMGAGKRAYERPSILRAMLIEADGQGADTICKLETNIDDCTGENLGYVMERLFEAGAKDVHYIPVFMKKNRPAYQLDVLCAPEDAPRLEEIIFAETTTIGIRRARMERTVLPRESRTVETPYGDARVKVCRLSGKERIFPEHESVAALCRAHGLSYREAYREILSCAEK